MAYKEIVSLDADTTVAIGGANRKTGKKNPTEVEGFYLGTKEVSSPKSKTGKASIHIFQTAKGNVGVWGKTDMDRKMRTAVPGAMTLVKFEKMQATPNGEMYKYSVAQDTDNTIEVDQVNTGDEGGNEGLDNDEDDTSDLQARAFEDEDEDQEAALQAAELAAARKAKVQALLGKKAGAKN